jgi:hypothetical protein
MSGVEDVNHEEVRVIETATAKTCFQWQSFFPPTLSRKKSAAISPSGELVAIAVRNKLSIYRVPADCSSSKTAPVK